MTIKIFGLISLYICLYFLHTLIPCELLFMIMCGVTVLMGIIINQTTQSKLKWLGSAMIIISWLITIWLWGPLGPDGDGNTGGYREWAPFECPVCPQKSTLPLPSLPKKDQPAILMDTVNKK